LGALGGSRDGRPKGRAERGQAAFEFLLILPFFVLFILLLIDFGIVMYGYVSVSNAAREGARFASVNCAAAGGGGCDLIDVQNRVEERSSGFVAAADVDVEWQGDDRGDSVAVTALRVHDFLFVPATIDIASCSAMRLEQDDPGDGPDDSSGSGSCP